MNGVNVANLGDADNNNKIRRYFNHKDSLAGPQKARALSLSLCVRRADR